MFFKDLQNFKIMLSNANKITNWGTPTYWGTPVGDLTWYMDNLLDI